MRTHRKPLAMLSLLLMVLMVLTSFPALAEGDRAMEGNLYLEGLPLVEEKETFSMMVDSNIAAEDFIMYPILEEQTNVHVDLIVYPYQIAAEKKAVALNTGEYPDVFGGWIVGTKDILTTAMIDETFIPLEDYIAKYSPMMTDMLEQPGVRQTMTTPNGHIYSIPYLIGTPQVNFLPWINTKWLKALNLEVPTTTDELKAVLTAFKDNAGKNGIPADVIPFSADPVNMNLGQMAGWFGLPLNNGRESEDSGFTMKDGQLIYGANTDEYKQLILFLNDLNKNELLDPEFFTQNSDQWKAKGKQNLYGMSIAYGSGDFVDITSPKTRDKFDYDALPVLKGPGVENPQFQRGSYGSTVFKTQVVITDKAKNPATIIRWFDNVFQFDNSVQINSGLEGIKVKKISDTQYQDLDITGLSEAEQTKYDWEHMFTQSLPKYVPVGYKNLPAEGIEPDYDEKTAADTLYAPYLNEMIPSTWATDEDAKAMSTLSTDVRTYMLQKQAEWISGQADINAEWEEYKEQLNKLGLEKLLDIRRKMIGE